MAVKLAFNAAVAKMFLDIFMHGTDVCTRYGVGVSWQQKSLGDMDVIWTELKGMCMQDHRRMSKEQNGAL